MRFGFCFFRRASFSGGPVAPSWFWSPVAGRRLGAHDQRGAKSKAREPPAYCRCWGGGREPNALGGIRLRDCLGLWTGRWVERPRGFGAPLRAGALARTISAAQNQRTAVRQRMAGAGVGAGSPRRDPTPRLPGVVGGEVGGAPSWFWSPAAGRRLGAHDQRSAKSKDRGPLALGRCWGGGREP